MRYFYVYTQQFNGLAIESRILGFASNNERLEWYHHNSSWSKLVSRKEAIKLSHTEGFDPFIRLFRKGKRVDNGRVLF